LWERVAPKARGEGSLSRKLGENGLENAGRVSQDIIVPVAQHAVAGIRESPIARNIFGVVWMLPAIDLDDDLTLMTNEISDEISNRHLTSEFETLNLS
jgi:hypothetical protein